jgi:hypothetical protein
VAWKRKLLWIGTAGCLGLPVLALVSLVGLAKGCDYLGSWQAVASVREQLAEIKRGEMDFEAFVAAHPALKDNRDASFWHRTASIDAGSVILGNAVLTSNSGVREVFTYRIADDGGILIEPIETSR